MEFKNELPIRAFQSEDCFSVTDEGERDKNLTRCRVITRSIDLFIHGIETKNYVIAPAGVGKTGLCKLVADPRETILPRKKQYFFLHTLHGGEIVSHSGESGERIRDELLAYIVRRAKEHLEDYYYGEKPIYLEKPIVKAEKRVGSGKIGLGDSGLSGSLEEEIEYEKTTIEEQYQQLNSFLRQKQKQIIFCVDNLDDITLRMPISKKRIVMTAFYDATQFIRAKCDQVIPVLFVRDDLYRYINKQGEGNKTTKEITLRWEKEEILRFILKRFFAIPKVEETITNSHRKYWIDFGNFFGRRKDIALFVDALSDDACEDWLYSFFPKYIEVGRNSKAQDIKFFDWVFESLRDAKGVVAPRTVIKYMNSYLYYSYKSCLKGGISVFPKDNDSHFVIGDRVVALAALKEAQDHMITDYANHIIISDDEETPLLSQDIKRIVEYLIYKSKKGKIDISTINLTELSLSKSQFSNIVNELEFWGFFKAKPGSPWHTDYVLSPLLQRYIKVQFNF